MTKKRTGISLAEVLIAVLIFASGVLAVSATLMYSLRAVTDSRHAISEKQESINAAEKYLMRSIVSHDVAPTDMPPNGGYASLLQSSKNVSICGKNFKYSVYCFDMDKKASPVYILRREK